MRLTLITAITILIFVNINLAEKVSIDAQTYFELVVIPEDFDLIFNLTSTDKDNKFNAFITSTNDWKTCQNTNFINCKVFSKYDYIYLSHVQDKFPYNNIDAVLVIHNTNILLSIDILYTYTLIDKRSDSNIAALILLILIVCIPLCCLLIIITVPIILTSLTTVIMLLGCLGFFSLAKNKTPEIV